MKPTTKCSFFACILLLCSHVFLFSQQIYKGSISGRAGMALGGASILNKSSNKGLVSDSTGHFTLSATPGATLEISYVGYLSQQIVLGSQKELQISLTESITNLNEVVRIGYGTALRKDVTGAVASISTNQFNTGVITNPMQEVQGKVAGLVITQPGGDPNGDFIVRVRGATSLEGQPPLLVIDGVAVDSFQVAINTLNPGDVESFTILKDASSAAIYGSRGANGVILVTTKRGKAGKPQFEYSGFLSTESISRELPVLSASDWRKAAVGDTLAAGLDLGANTDWQKAISQTAFSQSHLLSVSGGGSQVSYRGSVGYINQQGVIQNTGKRMITARLNVDQKSLDNKLEIRYGLSTSVINRDFLPDQNSTSQNISNGPNNSNNSGSSINLFAAGFLPVWPVYNPDGTFFLPPLGGINPLQTIHDIYSKQKENFYQGSLKADYEILKGLRLGVLGALSEGNNVYDFFSPQEPGSNALSSATKANYNKQDFTGDIHGSYQKTFGKSSIDVTGVYEYNKFENDGFSLTARGILVPDLLDNNFGAATNVLTSDISSYKNEVILISFLGRLVYTYDNRYILTASFRRDGSSKFGPNNAWGNFPSVAVAWRASNEKFMQGIGWLNNLKFRVSYGYTGNQENLPPYKYQQTYNTAGPYLNNSQTNQILQSYAVNQEYNPDLKWEVRKSFNAGMDFSILKDRVYGSLDVFNDKTSDMLYLYNIPQPPFLASQVYANAADAINKGVELTLGAVIIKKSKFSWDIQGNVATLTNRITNLLGQFKGTELSITNPGFGGAGGGALGFSYITQLAVGHPAGVFWIPQHAGFDAAGNELFNNYNSNGKLVGTSTTYGDSDRVYIDPTPRYTWGFTSNFYYGNFDFSFFIRGVEGQKIFGNSLMAFGSTKLFPGTNITKEALSDGFKELAEPSTFWLRDGSYIRMQNITLGYNFRNIKGINKLRVYVVATNLFTITNYNGVDPEVSTDGQQRYIEQGYYPKTRGFTFGINAGF
jgi:TonB-dependent starch-binding outer membrane protein SusC